jgi:hypothetical protein
MRSYKPGKGVIDKDLISKITLNIGGFMDVKELYPESEGTYFCSYQPMIDSWGEVLVQVDDHDYQGDTRVLLKKGKKIGLITFGWGSCSGCDALQACSNYRDLQNLYDVLESNIKWMTPKESLKYFREHDWKGDYGWHTTGRDQFVKEAIVVLEEMCK